MSCNEADKIGGGLLVTEGMTVLGLGFTAGGGTGTTCGILCILFDGLTISLTILGPVGTGPIFLLLKA